MSTKPGVTIRPRASISSAPRADTRPTLAIVPPRIATSASNDAPPLPSNTVPLRMTRSKSDIEIGLRPARAECPAQRIVSGDGGALHHPRLLGRHAGRAVQGPPVVPQHHVAHPPVVEIGERGIGG